MCVRGLLFSTADGALGGFTFTLACYHSGGATSKDLRAMTTPTPAASMTPSAIVRVDAMTLSVESVDLDSTRYEIVPEGRVTAGADSTLVVFAAHSGRCRWILRLQGQCSQAFEAQLVIEGRRVGGVSAPKMDAQTGDFSLELSTPIEELPAPNAKGLHGISLAISNGRVLPLTRVKMLAVTGPAPTLRLFEVLDATDTFLYDAPPRKTVDLSNPEEGFWIGSGRFQLQLQAEWSRIAGGEGSNTWKLDSTPLSASHDQSEYGDTRDVLFEEIPKRKVTPVGDNSRTEFSLLFDTSHGGLKAKVTAAGYDLAVRWTSEHVLECAGARCRLLWRRDFSLRVRDPAALLGSFRRLSAVGIDFGTSATVAAFTSRGYRALMRLGAPKSEANPAENPTFLLIEDHEALFKVLASVHEGAAEGSRRCPHLVGLVQASHLAREALRTAPNAVVGEIKSLPERVMQLDQSPLLRDRTKHVDFLLDEQRVRALVRAYAYLLGRAINRPGQEVYLRYWLTWPAEFDDRARELLEQELRAGLLASVPEGIAASEVVVQMASTEPEAYAAEVCPELVNHPALEPVLSKHGELRFAVFDFGGGTLDIACGRYRPATEQEQAQSGASAVVEVLQVAGDDHLGGDYLTSEFAWLSHQHSSVFAEMESADIPMQRPATIPENKLARSAHLYKRSLAGRQNQVRFIRELELEQLKFKRSAVIPKKQTVRAVKIDGAEVALGCFAKDNSVVRDALVSHLESRIEEGARLLLSMLQNIAWGSEGDWRAQGVQILLAGNSSRGEFVASALGKVLGYPDLKVWRPSDTHAPEGVILYETPSRMERGVEVLGVTPKTAVALGALKIANREVHLVRAQQGFSYFVGDMRGFPPKFIAILPMGTLPANPEEWGPHYLDFGTWDAQKPLRVAKEYSPGKMSSNDPRLLTIATGLPAGATGKLYICVISPTRIALHLAVADGQNHVRTELNLAPFLS